MNSGSLMYCAAVVKLPAILDMSGNYLRKRVGFF